MGDENGVIVVDGIWEPVTSSKVSTLAMGQLLQAFQATVELLDEIVFNDDIDPTSHRLYSGLVWLRDRAKTEILNLLASSNKEGKEDTPDQKYVRNMYNPFKSEWVKRLLEAE